MLRALRLMQSQGKRVDSSQPINIGLMGLGVVGGGVASVLISPKESLLRKVGRPILLKKVLIRDREKPRSLSLPPELLTTDPQEILGDPEVQVVVEVMGGEEPAGQYLKEAISRGKHVVTANKELMAKAGPDLMELAAGEGVNLLFEASVGGGIPVVGPLMKDLLANKIRSIHAIINGTTNYILTRMAKDGMAFDEALKEAQELGYAESDPTNDIEGIDAAYKLAILATLAFHTRVYPQDIYTEGISHLKTQDFRHALELGYAIKLLAIAREENGALEVRVHPAFVPLQHLLANVNGAYNAVEVEGSLVGRVVLHGQGAGRNPTTSAVLGDVVEIAHRIISGGDPPQLLNLPNHRTIKPIAQLASKYYLRLNVADRAGVLSQISKVLGDLNISIDSVIQKGSDPINQTAEMVITTHPSQEAAVQESLNRLQGLDVVREMNSLIRIEDWPQSE